MTENLLKITANNKSDFINFAQFAKMPLVYLNSEFTIIDYNEIAGKFFGWKRNDGLNNNFNEWCKTHNLKTPFTTQNQDLLLSGKALSSQKNLFDKNDLVWDILPTINNNQVDFITLVGKNIQKTNKANNSNNLNIEINHAELSFISRNLLGYEIEPDKSAKDFIKIIYNYFESIISEMPCYVYWKDKNFVYLGCNKLTAQLLNLSSKKDIIGKTDYDFGWKNEDVDAFRKVDKEIIETGKSKLNIEEIIHTKNGIIHLLVNKMPIFNEKNDIVGIIGISVDITERKDSERLVDEKISAQANSLQNELSNISRHIIGYDIGSHKSAKDYIASIYNYLENIIAYMPGYVFWKNKNFVYLGCNDLAAKELLGLSSRKSIVGKTDYDFGWDKKIVDEFRKVDKEIIKTGLPKLDIEDTVTVPGRGQVDLLVNKMPIFNDNHEVIGIVGISIDITERKKIEAKLRETEHKLEGMTLIAASIAHELRTPLASITSAIASISLTLPHLIEAYNVAKEANLSVHKFNASNLKILGTLLKNITFETESANLVINMLLMNLKPSIENTKNEIFSITECVKGALSRYPYQPGEIKLVFWDEKSPDFMVNGNQSFITHVLFNLLRNALYYLAKSGKPTEETRIQIWLEKDKGYNKLHFKDTGTGMPPEVLEHIFDRFFSKTYHGAGIGLTFCKMVMESLGGSIECESKEGEYTLFTLAFPNENMYNK